jgi:Fibronectin type III domain
MTDAKRGRGSRRGIYLCAVAALGFALSGCGGGGGPTGAAATSQAATGVASNDNTNPAPPTASVGAVTLNWTPPTENTDGTPLTNLAGYDIHYGTASGDYTQSVSVSNPGLATYVVDNLDPGTYYFSISAVNSTGAESPLSSEVSMTVN